MSPSQGGLALSPLLSHLECSRTGERYDFTEPRHLSRAGAPLLVRYDLAGAARSLTLESLAGRRTDLWRYAEVLPIAPGKPDRTLRAGGTPLHHAPRLGAELGLDALYVKDESTNPTASFKARGMAVAVAMASYFGAKAVAAPSAGNAASALAAYAARAGIPAHVAVPRDTPPNIVAEARALGADLRFVDGLIGDAGRLIAEGVERHGWYDVATLKEPYRVEGKKTMGYELFEQLDRRLPDVILYPTGGATGLIGMWKAFDEMEALGWIGAERPRMVAVQASGCAPLLRALEQGREECEVWAGAHTRAPGLRVPKALGDFLALRVLRESKGTAVAVDDDTLEAAALRIARTEGVFACPEGGACLAALEVLRRDGHVHESDTVVLFNTASGAKYLQ